MCIITLLEMSVIFCLQEIELLWYSVLAELLQLGIRSHLIKKKTISDLFVPIA